MDYNKLYNSLANNDFIDLKLILQNANKQIILNLHKIILYSCSIYFEKLLTSCKEKLLNEITIQVPNVNICYDIIMSFYGQKTNIANYPEWEYILRSYECYEFFGLNFDHDSINIVVPAEGFDLLLDSIDLIGY